MEQLAIPSLKEALFLLPMTVLSIFACVPITLKVLNKNKEPSNWTTLFISLVGIVLAGITLCYQTDVRTEVFSKALLFDPLSLYSSYGILAITAMTLLMSASGVNTKGQSFAEHTFLVLFSSVGMLTLVSTTDLIVSFIGLEIMSIALYILIGLGHEQQYSKEAAFKYFILGSFAAAVFLYGVAFIYGVTGTTQITAQVLTTLGTNHTMALLGVILVFVGIAFKVSLFPFHAWTPDVYQGAPTSISGFMATGVKLVMFTLLLRLSALGLFNISPKMISVLQVLAIMTMTIGNITAIVQDNIKRLIAYSSIAHAGYIMVGIIVASTAKTPDAASATIFYLISYSVMNIGAFAVVNIFEKEQRGNLSVSDYSGLGFKYPWMGLAMSIFMLSLAGIPPTAGFIGKFYLFAAAIKDGFIWLAILGVFNSLLSVYYYLRILVYMYMKEEVYDVRPQASALSKIVVAVSVALTIIMGILSTPFYEPAVRSILSSIF